MSTKYVLLPVHGPHPRAQELWAAAAAETVPLGPASREYAVMLEIEGSDNRRRIAIQDHFDRINGDVRSIEYRLTDLIQINTALLGRLQEAELEIQINTALLKTLHRRMDTQLAATLPSPAAPHSARDPSPARSRSPRSTASGRGTPRGRHRDEGALGAATAGEGALGAMPLGAATGRSEPL